MNLANIRGAEWTEKLLFGGPQGYAASASETFRTVSLGNLVNKARCFKASATGNKCVVADVPTLEKEMEVISRRCLPWMM